MFFHRRLKLAVFLFCKNKKTVKLLTDPFVNYKNYIATFSTIRAKMIMKMNTKMNTI